MPSQNVAENWLPLVEFAAKKGVSLSTLRRYIKAQKIEFRLEKGRYLVRDDSSAAAPSPPKFSHEKKTFFPNLPDPPGSQASYQRQQLETELKKARQEIAELKTLIAYYEEKFPNAL